METEELTEMLAEFNEAYAARYPNLRAALKEIHEVSIAYTSPIPNRGSSIRIVGDFSPEKAAAVVSERQGSWVSRERFLIVLINSACQPPREHVVSPSYGCSTYKRWNRSWQAFARKRGVLKPPAHVVRNKSILTRHRFEFADGKFTVSESMIPTLMLVSRERPLVKYELVHEVVDAPQQPEKR